MKSENSKNVPMVVIRRLPRYYRYLGELLKQGVTRISSKSLSEKMGVTASQIRQDLNCFGGFGQQGYGYKIENLYYEIGEILGLSRGYKTVIVGAGNLGRALANHAGFEKRGFRLMALFDNDEAVIGKKIHGLTIQPMDHLEEFFEKEGADIAILAVPKSSVKEVADRLVALGIKGLWNFSYTDIDVPEHVAVENVHLTDSLMTLAYKLTKEEMGSKE
ncbi:MAG: redox-sensing transcriptional repressor Rex [Clostridia bacterium]|nr:redox-sensing transcriptional repressor Rex [Clostridia bacterium]MBQ3553584.1 redox-sensing transcriptional repressor Rex [Clostridia bacterium]